MSELIDLSRLLTFCMYFSKKPFPVFLESAGFSKEDVLIQEPKAGVSFYPSISYLLSNMKFLFLSLS